MKAYWVADTIPEPTELELIYTLLSVRMWKWFHPDIPTCLYTDTESWTYLQVINLWDEVVFFDFPTDILKGDDELWAAGKLQAMKHFDAPFCILDLDMFYTDKIQFDAEVISAHLEVGTSYYRKDHPEFNEVGIEPFSTSYNALNVSFLYIQTAEFHKEYVETSIDWMQRLSKKGYVNGSFMTFCEQKLLLDIVERDNVPYRTLVQNPYKCVTRDWEGGMNNPNYFHLQFYKKVQNKNTTEYLKRRGEAIKVASDIDKSISKELFDFLQKNILN